MREYKNAICQPKGFKASAIACGLKKNKELDLALIYSEATAVACGMFTRNKFAAAPVKVCREHLKAKQSQAIVVNSGNANCWTGAKGLLAAQETTRLSAELLGLRQKSVLVASTGIIGKPIDFAKIKKALPILINSLAKNSKAQAARAIMTTDTRPKELMARIKMDDKIITLGAMAKGAGMLAPDMACIERSRSATMLCFITTDALIQYSALKEALKEAVENSFNLLSVDGCMSTNDSVIALANGLAQNKLITSSGNNFPKFKAALKEICLGLAKMLVYDAEGASKFVAIKVSGAKDNCQARRAALAIANSNLFKTAVYGENPNWGRIVAAVGASGAEAKDDIVIACSSFKKKNISVKVDLKSGPGMATVYTSDLTPEYVRINASYN